MPRNPHVQPEPDRLLEDCSPSTRCCARLDSEDRLVWYNLHTAPSATAGHRLQVVQLRGRPRHPRPARRHARCAPSASTAARTYATAFASSRRPCSTTARRPSTCSSTCSTRIAAEHEIDLAPAGAAAAHLRRHRRDPDGRLPGARALDPRPLEHPVEIVNWPTFPTPQPRDQANRGRTGSRSARFMIPELCGFQGRALYLDADMLVFGDIAELATCPSTGTRSSAPRSPSTRKPGTTTSASSSGGRQRGRHAARLLRRLDWKSTTSSTASTTAEYAYEDADVRPVHRRARPRSAETIPPEWNHLERYEPGVTKNVHFTVVNDQPWKVDDNPLEPLWRRRLQGGDGRRRRASVRGRCGGDRGHIKASLADACAARRVARHQMAPARRPAPTSRSSRPRRQRLRRRRPGARAPARRNAPFGDVAGRSNRHGPARRAPPVRSSLPAGLTGQLTRSVIAGPALSSAGSTRHVQSTRMAPSSALPSGSRCPTRRSLATVNSAASQGGRACDRRSRRRNTISIV